MENGEFEFDGMIFTSQLAEIAKLMNTNTNLFINGPAGTGKSSLIRAFRKNTDKNIEILAPTGIAARNIDGRTVHSCFRLPPRLITPEDAVSKKWIMNLKGNRSRVYAEKGRVTAPPSIAESLFVFKDHFN